MGFESYCLSQITFINKEYSARIQILMPCPWFNGQSCISATTLKGCVQNQEWRAARVLTTYFAGDIYSGLKNGVNVGGRIPKKSKACLNANVSRKKKTFREEMIYK